MRSITRTRGRSALALAVAGITAVALAACGTSGETTPEAQGGDPVRGGTLTLIQSAAINSWHPGAISPAQTFQRMQAVYDALLYVDDDGEIVPGIAESLESDDAGATWTMTLRPGVKFSDGEPLDAAAVKFTYDVIAEDGYSGGLAQSLTTEVVDDTTLRLSLDEAEPTLPYRIAEALPFIASPTSLEGRGDVYADPIGAGPFVLESSDSAQGERFTRNDNYWDEGKPYVDELRTVIIADPAQRTLTVSQGGADAMNGYGFWYTAVEGNPGLRTERLESGGFRSFVFNTANGFFSDPRARQAVAFAINPDELVQANLTDPSQVGSTNMFPESSPYYDAAFDMPNGDLDAAQDLFDEVSGGTPVTVKLLVPSAPENIRTSELLQLQMQAIDGLTVDLVPIPLADWRGAALDEDDFDVSFYPGVYDLNPVATSLPSALRTGGRENFTNFSDPAMDAALEELRRASNEEERVAAVRDIQGILVEQVPFVPFGIDYRTFLLNDAAQGVTLTRPYIVHTQDIWFPAG